MSSHGVTLLAHMRGTVLEVPRSRRSKIRIDISAAVAAGERPGEDPREVEDPQLM
jgi:hypothetical protein